MKKRFYLLTLFILSIEILFCGMNIHSFQVYAKEASDISSVEGKVFEYKENKNFTLSKKDKGKKNSKKNSMGSLNLNGSIFVDSSKENGFISDSKDISISYNLFSNKLTEKETEWHIVSSNAKKVNDIDTNKKIKKGVLIIQT